MNPHQDDHAINMAREKADDLLIEADPADECQYCGEPLDYCECKENYDPKAEAEFRQCYIEDWER